MVYPEHITITLPHDAVATLADPVPENGSEKPKVAALRQADPAPASHLELGAQIAEGGMGLVVAGVDSALERSFAAKMLKPDTRTSSVAVRRFLNEARMTASLEHPHIIPVHALARHADTGPFFTMKLVEGHTLLDHLRKVHAEMYGDVLDEIIGMLIKVCDALELAHSRGIAHCDLKAANIMLGEFGQVYLTDWGIAREFPGTAPTLRDGTPAICGTPTMMAPEQAMGARVNALTDVFGIGSLLYFILAKRSPFTTKQLRAGRARIAPPLAEVAPATPAALVAIVERAMASQPGDRYPSIAALRSDLDRYRRGRLDVNILRVKAGERLIRQGAASTCMYLVREGQFRVIRRHADGTNEDVRRVGPDSVLGEAGVLSGGERSATVIAETDGVVAVVTKQNLSDALSRIPSWLRTVIETTGARFHEREVK